MWELTWIFPLSFSSPDVSKFQTHCFHLFLSPSSPRSPFWPGGPTSPFMPSLPSRPGIPWEEGTPGTPGVPGVPGGPAGPWIGHVTMHELSHCLWKKAKNGFTCRYSYVKKRSKGEMHNFRRMSGATNDNFRKNICSEDDLRSRIFVTFVVKFLACLPLLGFSNI